MLLVLAFQLLFDVVYFPKFMVLFVILKFRFLHAQHPVVGLIYDLTNCLYSSQIQAIHLDDVMHQPEDPSMEHVFNYETKTLRDTQQMLSAVDIQDAYSYVEEHSHPRLWISLANHALETLDLSYAEKVGFILITLF